MEQSWTEWESIQVSSNSDSCRLDHLCFFGREVWGVENNLGAFSRVVISLLVTMIVLDNLIHQWGEHFVGIVTSGIDTDTRVNILATGENGVLKIKVELIFFGNKIIVNISS